MKPMLAHRWEDHSHKLTYPLYVQPKLNGVRALFFNGTFQSRDEHHWSPSILAHLTPALLTTYPHLLLDGELYLHGTPLQTINGAISVNRNSPTHLTPSIQYWIFDCIPADNPDADFAARHAMLEAHSHSLPPSIRLTPTHLCNSPSEADHYFSKYKSEAYEGLMYRPNLPYGLSTHCTNKQNRWSRLLKRKDWLDSEFTCIDIECGTGKYSESVGALVFESPTGLRFTAGSGLTDAERTAYLHSPPIGHTFRVRYETLSLNGIPLKPTIEAVL